MKTIIYIGDFDIRNENVQAHLVMNMGKLLNKLGYKIVYICNNRKCNNFNDIKKLPSLNTGDGNQCFEIPNSLTFNGVFLYYNIKKAIINILEDCCSHNDVYGLITYQSPTFSCFLSSLIDFCESRNIPYIVNSADITKFDSQPFFRRVAMELNWKYLHYINYKKASGIIAVSKYISDFYQKSNRPSVIVPPLFDSRVKLIKEKRNTEIIEFIYAGTPFGNFGRKVNTNGMKDRLDKIIDLFINLQKIKSNFHFKIVGMNFNDYIVAVPRHKESLANNKNIIFVGHKAHTETLNHVYNSDYMINFRDHNKMTEAGLSTKVVESVSVGTPVIMSDVGDTFLYLQENCNGYKLTGDIVQDTKLLLGLMSLDSNQRMLLKQKCAQYNPFKIDNYVDKLQAFLNEVHVYNQYKNMNKD